MVAYIDPKKKIHNSDERNPEKTPCPNPTFDQQAYGPPQENDQITSYNLVVMNRTSTYYIICAMPSLNNMKAVFLSTYNLEMLLEHVNSATENEWGQKIQVKMLLGHP